MDEEHSIKTNLTANQVRLLYNSLKAVHGVRFFTETKPDFNLYEGVIQRLKPLRQCDLSTFIFSPTEIRAVINAIDALLAEFPKEGAIHSLTNFWPADIKLLLKRLERGAEVPA